jgi:hypothetical protein
MQSNAAQLGALRKFHNFSPVPTFILSGTPNKDMPPKHSGRCDFNTLQIA